MRVMASREGLRPVVFIGASGFLVLLPWMGATDYWIRQIILVATLSLVVSGLNLTFGFAGELALGQAAVYATGAFAAGYFAIHFWNDIVLALIFSVVMSVIIGLIAGAPGIRLGGWMLAIGSFFLVLLVPDVVRIIGDSLGTREGMTGIPLPHLLGRELNGTGYYVVVIIVAAIWFALFRNLILSAYGSSFRVLGAGEALCSAVGMSTYKLKLKAYAVGAVPAGIAGCLFAYLDGYVAALSFGLDTTLIILAAGVIGGLRTVYGAILGAAFILLGPASSTAFEDYATVAYGVFLLAGGVLLSEGLLPLLTNLVRRLTPEGPPSHTREVERELTVDFEPIAGDVLEVHGVRKSFGGSVALDGPHVECGQGKVTALIGPNGSGKTTLLNLVSGYYAADSGTIELGGTDIQGRRAHERARLGVGRTFQTPDIPLGLSVRQAVRSGALVNEAGLLATMLRLPSYWRRERTARTSTERIMASLGLGQWAEHEAISLPLGTRRLVELGRALAIEPRVLLLDEVASGLDNEEVDELRSVIGRLRTAGATIVLVEHNFDLVKAVADKVYVLAEGQLLASGSASEMASDERVRATYLGAGPAVAQMAAAGDGHKNAQVAGKKSL